jgi:hypothetical protein
MNIDTEHLHYWMCAIRESNDPIRTLDAFWRGQILSKEWLIKNLTPYIDDTVSVDIHGGWFGVLASLMFQSDIGSRYRYICSVDIDPLCEHVATMMNKKEEQDGKFKAITGDMCKVHMRGNVIINTSCEHITQEQYEKWLDNVPEDSLIVLQSNDYKIPEHVRTSSTLQEFEAQSHINKLYSGSLKLPLYNRHMIIGKKCII